MTQRLPGIVKIGLIPYSSLPDNIVYIGKAGMIVSINTTLDYIELIGQATCEINEVFDNNSAMQRAEIKLTTTNVIKNDDTYAMVLFTANGDKYLVGGDKDCFLLAEYELTTGATSGDASAYVYKISYTAPLAIVGAVVS